MYLNLSVISCSKQCSKQLHQVLSLLASYLSTSSLFFPLVGAALHCNQRFSAGMVSVDTSRPPKLAPGMSSSRIIGFISLTSMTSLHL